MAREAFETLLPRHGTSRILGFPTFLRPLETSIYRPQPSRIIVPTRKH
jgi:hypothetical protein